MCTTACTKPRPTDHNIMLHCLCVCVHVVQLREVREQCGVSGPSENNRRKRQRESSKERTTPRMDTSRSSKTNDTGSGSGDEEDTSRSSRTSKGTSRGTSRSTTGKSTGTSTTTTGKSTGDSTTGAVLDIAGDVEFIPLALVEEVFELNGAFEYGTFVAFWIC